MIGVDDPGLAAVTDSTEYDTRKLAILPRRARRVIGRSDASVITPDGRAWRKYGTGPYVTVSEPHEPATVGFCGRPSKWANPFVVERSKCSACAKEGNSWRVRSGSATLLTVQTRKKAVLEAAGLYCLHLAEQPDEYFADLADCDYLSCHCDLGAPCHVDLLIVELKRRFGEWLP